MLELTPQSQNREEGIRHAKEAQRLLDSPLIQKFFEGSRAHVANAFVASTTPEERETLYAEARGIERLRIYLQMLVDNGKHIEAQIAKEDKAASTSAR